MTSVMQPLKDEHQELLPHIEGLRTAGQSVDQATEASLLQAVSEAHAFLVHHLIPHATAEDRVLYPLVESVMNAPGATDTMRRDHVEVGELTRELGTMKDKVAESGATETDLTELRRLLFGLYAVVRLHFDKEEEIYVPLLEKALSADDARELFEKMEAAAGEAKAAAAAA